MTAKGVNFALFSEHAEAIDLSLFDADGGREVERIRLGERSDHVWHGLVEGIGPGQRYGFRVHGPFAPETGARFNPNKLLIDPYARALDRPFRLSASMFGYDPADPAGDLSFSPVDSAPECPKAIVTKEPDPFSRNRPETPWESTVIYEAHVRGLTKRHPDVPERLRGRFAGLADKAVIDHLVRLGVSTVELLPVAAFIDERHLTALGLSNYWGYNPVSFLAPEPRYLAAGMFDEVAATIETLHQAGLEIILDVVFNHTGEGDELGPTVSFRGIDNQTYYRLRADAPRYYENQAGCGNVLAADRPVVTRLIMDALRHWAALGVDGFRFDLATTLSRTDTGLDLDGAFLSVLRQDPVLSRLKLIVEPWDLGADGHRLGAYPGGIGEWNDRYRDDVRRYWRGDTAMIGALATRLTGSADAFRHSDRRPASSINYVAAHDGFTLADLTAFEHKHNEANGEENRDGTDTNLSWNHGVEGASDDPDIRAARRRDVLNLLATLLLSRGTPMLTAGDEFGRSQNGNNNAYAQDTPLSWLDWEAYRTDEGATALADFVAALIRLRAAHPALHRSQFLDGTRPDGARRRDAIWRRADGAEMSASDWNAPENRFVGLELTVPDPSRPAGVDHVFLVFNSSHDDFEVLLPAPDGGWRCVLDTAAFDPTLAIAIGGMQHRVMARSVMVFEDGPAALGADDSKELIRLAERAGIERHYHQHDGSFHHVSADSLRAILGAMRLPAESHAAVLESSERFDARQWRLGLPAMAIGRAERPLSVDLTVDEDSAGHRRKLRVVENDGNVRAFELFATAGTMLDRARIRGEVRQRWRVVLPVMLKEGYHRLVDEDTGSETVLVIAPLRCYLPSAIVDGDRLWGVGTHLYTLRRAGDWGIGDLTALDGLVDTVAGWGADAIGLNPLHALFPGSPGRASPYHPSDRRFLEPHILDPMALPDFADLADSDPWFSEVAPTLERLRSQKNVDYNCVIPLKRTALARAYLAFRKTRLNVSDDPLSIAFRRFLSDGGRLLSRFAIFSSLQERYPDTPWRHWPEGFDAPKKAHIQSVRETMADSVLFHAFVQWQADRSLAAIAEHGRDAGMSLGLYRDLAVGAAPDGAEAWAEQLSMTHGVWMGAPPDPFSASGQNWHIPPFDPHALREAAFEPFRTLVAANMRHAGALRIDHAMGLTRQFWVPDGAQSSEGAYVRMPADTCQAILALESHRHRCMVVGEDLGTVADGFREWMADSAMLSTRVLLFERDGAMFRPETHYPRLSVACASTHDLPPFTGWWKGIDIAVRGGLDEAAPEAIEAEKILRSKDRAALLEALDLADQLTPERDSSEAEVAAAAHGFLAAAPSALVLAQVDDLVGEEAQLNIPGTDRQYPNWRRRLDVPVEDLARNERAKSVVDAIKLERFGPISALD